MDYRVRPGDTLSAIAAKFNVSLSAVEAANPQIPDPNKIFPDELVHIPGSQAQAHDLVQVPPPHALTYVVQPGDSMSAIAAAHNISLGALEAANPQVINPAVIHPGQILNLTAGSSTRGAPPPSPDDSIAISAVTYGKFTLGGGVPDWVTRACTIMHLPIAHWMAGYRVLCARESSGQPNAINAWDSNATGPIQADGYPLNCSRGVAQCVPGTFAAYHVPGTSTAIYDPVANIAASMRYVMRRYGVASDGSDLTQLVQQADINRSPRGY